MTKPPPKQEPKKERPTELHGMMATSLILLVCILLTLLLMGYFVTKNTDLAEETNHLLSHFQRIDTVKDDHWFCYYQGSKKKFCVNTTYVSSIRDPAEDNSQSDPNLCKKWKSDCKDDKDDNDCKVICEMGPE